ncbi:hypothetical protein HNQ44_000846 [Planomicrobium koreense]|uniref:Uncharacterized protein n=1 Tax=Planococcus koreensis TaxID=112331 RepID=A0A7W8FU40_9BACL|nr:hypothetical protein [Planococcus koreensis]
MPVLLAPVKVETVHVDSWLVHVETPAHLVSFPLVPVNADLVHVNVGKSCLKPQMDAFRLGEMRKCLRRSRSPGANGFSIYVFELRLWRGAFLLVRVKVGIDHVNGNFVHVKSSAYHDNSQLRHVKAKIVHVNEIMW